MDRLQSKSINAGLHSTIFGKFKVGSTFDDAPRYQSKKASSYTQMRNTYFFHRLVSLAFSHLHCKKFTADQGPVSRKSRELFGPEKPFVKLRPAFSGKLVFSYVVKGIKIKITAKFRASRLLRFEDTKRIMSPEIRPKSFGTFEKQAPDPLPESGASFLLRLLLANIFVISKIQLVVYH